MDSGGGAEDTRVAVNAGIQNNSGTTWCLLITEATINWTSMWMAPRLPHGTVWGSP